MASHSITVSIGGGLELERAGLAALIDELPGLRLIPLDRDRPPQVLVWQGYGAEGDYASYPAGTAVLLVTEALNSDSLPNSVRGALSKAEPASALGTAIRQIARGEQYLSPTLARAILEKRQLTVAPTAVQESVLESLTDREREILNCLAEGLSNKAIAARLYLSVRTVEGHLASIYNRLGVHSRTEAMLLAVKIR
jgi:DNA-binding CsgD family transcriptional regulator